MSDEQILCPACRHPMRRHSAFGCMANGGACECALAPEGSETPNPTPAPRPQPVRAPEPTPEPLDGEQVASLVAKAERSGVAKLTKQAEKVREAIDVLDELVTGHEKRTEAEETVAKLRRELAEAEAKLREIASGRPLTKAAERGHKAEQLREIRRWALANSLPCSPRGRIPEPVMDAYRAAHPGVAA